jgi:small-conductance mechanosensitive channel
MEEYFVQYQKEVLGSIILVLLILIVRFIAIKTVRRIGRKSDIKEVRTRLIAKYISYGLSFLVIAGLIFVWGVKIREIGLIFSSVFAVIGVALFAQWSILSNVTAGIILFFSFPFKIGDRIRIQDKDIDYQGHFIIEDIKAYHVYLRKENGELMTYPNNMMLQKAVSLIENHDNVRERSEVL